VAGLKTGIVTIPTKTYGCLAASKNYSSMADQEQGIRIGDLKDVIPDILHTKEALQNKSKEETPESLLASVLRTVLAENNPILEKQISETITKQVSQNMSFLLQAKERQEEERYRNLDHLIRQQQLYRKESVRTAPSRFFHRLLGEA